MKEKLREEILEKRNSLDKKKLKKKSKKIIKRLRKLKEFKKAKTIMFYVSKGSEVYTHDIIKKMIKKKKIIVPVTDFKNKDLILSEINDFKELEPGYYNVLEPKNVKEVDINKIDVVIVPGVVFDKKKNRIGYGEGYYDIFLKKAKALKIGLCFDFQLIDEIKKEKYDVAVDVIVTDKYIIHL